MDGRDRLRRAAREAPVSGLAAALAVVLAVVLAGCDSTTIASPGPTGPLTVGPSPVATSPAATPPASPGTSPDRVASWQADLALLIPGMARIHPDLYHGVSEAALTDAVTALSATVPTATDDELLDGVLRIVAMVSAGGCDAHTGAYIWGEGTYPVDSLPLRLWLFGEDVVVVGALEPYRQLVGATITSIEGRPTAEVVAALDPLIPRDNEQTVRLLTPRFLLIPQVLRGLGLADAGPITLTVNLRDGQPATLDVTPIPMADYNAWAGAYGLHLPANPAVRYLSRMDDLLWWELLPDESTLYVQYNRVELPTPGLQQLGLAMLDPAVDRVLLDLRHNYGGELRGVDPIVELFQDPVFDEPDHLFIATGRNTFSAGSIIVARLKRDTAAQVVGEAMGGCPTFWSDPTSLVLPWSGISIGVADDVAVGVDPNDTRHGILPDVEAILGRDEWLAGDDPVTDLFKVVAP